MEIMLARESLTTWMREKRRQITEGEVGQAEALLAARDIVDSLQQMMEKVGKIQNEQLPALTDTIRDQIGSQQSDSYKQQMQSIMTTVSEALSTARDQSDIAVRTLSGEETPRAMKIGSDEGSDESGIDSDLDDNFGASDAAAGGSDAAGRELR